jgi:hypothetical protein
MTARGSIPPRAVTGTVRRGSCLRFRFLAAWVTFDPSGAQAWFPGCRSLRRQHPRRITRRSCSPWGGRWIPNFERGRIVGSAWGHSDFHVHRLQPRPCGTFGLRSRDSAAAGMELTDVLNGCPAGPHLSMSARDAATSCFKLPENIMSIRSQPGKLCRCGPDSRHGSRSRRIKPGKPGARMKQTHARRATRRLCFTMAGTGRRRPRAWGFFRPVPTRSRARSCTPLQQEPGASPRCPFECAAIRPHRDPGSPTGVPGCWWGRPWYVGGASKILGGEIFDRSHAWRFDCR